MEYVEHVNIEEFDQEENGQQLEGRGDDQLNP